MRYAVPLVLSHLLVAVVVLSAGADADTGSPCPCVCECDTGAPPVDTAPPPVDTSGDTGAPLLVLLAGQSNCVGKKALQGEPVVGGTLYDRGVLKSVYGSSSVERALVGAGHEVHKWCKDGVTTSEWVTLFRADALADLGRSPDVLVWIHGEAHTHTVEAATGYAAEVEAEVLDVFAPSLTVWPEMDLPSRLGAPTVNAEMEALALARGDIAIVDTTGLVKHPDGLHYIWTDPYSFPELQDRVFAEVP